MSLLRHENESGVSTTGNEKRDIYQVGSRMSHMSWDLIDPQEGKLDWGLFWQALIPIVALILIALFTGD